MRTDKWNRNPRPKSFASVGASRRRRSLSAESLRFEPVENHPRGDRGVNYYSAVVYVEIDDVDARQFREPVTSNSVLGWIRFIGKMIGGFFWEF